MDTVRILGIDPGLLRTGFGVVDQRGPRLTYVASGVIRIAVSDSIAERLVSIFTQIGEVVAEYKPTIAAIEKVYVNVNPATTLLLGQARGAAITALAAAGLPVAEYTPAQIKLAIAGHGQAQKAQVQAMIVRLLRLPGEPAADAADALACAACHAHSSSLVGALAARSAVPRRRIAPTTRRAGPAR